MVLNFVFFFFKQKTAYEITHIPAQFFTVTIKELPDENFGIGGKSIDEIKRNYKP